MHEMGVAQSICSTVRPYVGEGRQLRTVVVEHGPFSGISPESLGYCFSIVARSMGFPLARLDLRAKHAEAYCSACSEKQQVESTLTRCRRCGHHPLTVSGGRELRIAHVEVEEMEHV